MMTFFFHKMRSRRRLQEYASYRLREKIDRFVSKLVDVRIDFLHEHQTYTTVCHLRAGDGFRFHIKATSDDPYASVDQLAEKLTTVLSKQKDKLKNHKNVSQLKKAHLEKLEGIRFEDDALVAL